MCFWETNKLSYKTTATFNLNNMVYCEDLSLSGILWKTPHIFAGLYYLSMELQTNNSGLLHPNEGCFNSYKGVGTQGSWSSARPILFPGGKTGVQEADTACLESHRQ